MKEAHAVVEMIKELIKPGMSYRKINFSDIGIVTPYKLQCRIISKLCDKLNYSGVTIGSAEVFQGQERPIIILSTVRTGGILGFLNSAQVSLITLSLKSTNVHIVHYFSKFFQCDRPSNRLYTVLHILYQRKTYFLIIFRESTWCWHALKVC